MAEVKIKKPQQVYTVTWEGGDDEASVELFRTKKGAVASVRGYLEDSYDRAEIASRMRNLTAQGWCPGYKNSTFTLSTAEIQP